MRKTYVILFSIVLLAIGWLSASVYYSHKNSSTTTTVRVNSSDYQFINPLLLVDNSNIKFPELDPLKAKIGNFIKSAKSDDSAKDISVYFRDLTSGKWTGVDETALYDPSSMTKVLTLMAYLKLAQSDPEILNEKIYFDAAPDPGQFFKPENNLTPGDQSIRDLLLNMIINSDNRSMQLLNQNRPDAILSVFKELGLPTDITIGKGYMSPELYSRVFRTLYSSTYLSRDYSEQALKLLSSTTFNLGIVAGTASTTVSHKFGEHTFVNPDGSLINHELHDCGIVYYPDKPYLICIMTRGDDFAKLEKVVSGISSLVYKEVEAKDI